MTAAVFEVRGIFGEMMRLFSSRRESITADLRARAARFERAYGRAPSQRGLAQLAQSSNFATRKGREGVLDLAQSHAGGADRLARSARRGRRSLRRCGTPTPTAWSATRISSAGY